MAIIIAEYLGQRTDSAQHITPVTHPPFPTPIPLCPFIDLPCKKMSKKKNPKFPICSLRRNNEVYIVCEHRLVSTTINPSGLSNYQRQMLLTLGHELLNPNLTINEIAFKREVKLPSKHKADYVLSVANTTNQIYGPSIHQTYGPPKLLVEMQGGGETSYTGLMTTHVQNWTDQKPPTNTGLRANLPAKVGLIPTNAWRRLQEQLLLKCPSAIATGYGFVACVGTIIFDYVKRQLNDFAQVPFSNNPNGIKWNIALVTFAESSPAPIQPGAIPLTIDRNRTIYTTYTDLAQAMISRGSPCPNVFTGAFKTLAGTQITIP